MWKYISEGTERIRFSLTKKTVKQRPIDALTGRQSAGATNCWISDIAKREGHFGLAMIQIFKYLKKQKNSFV